MSSHHVARLRLLALCVAVACRTAVYAAIACQALRILQAGNLGDYRPLTLAAILGLCAMPALVLTPLLGTLAASRWNRTVLIAGSMVALGVMVLTRSDDATPWLSVAGILALEGAFFTCAVLGLMSTLTSAAGLGHICPRLTVLIAALVGACLVAGNQQATDAAPVVSLLVVALAATVFVRVPMPRPVALAGGMVRPFLTGTRDALRHRYSRATLLGFGVCVFMAVTMAAVLIRIAPDGQHDAIGAATARCLAAMAIGAAFSGLSRNSFRHGGLIPYAAVLALVACVWLRCGERWEAPLLLLGFAVGMSLSPLLHVHQTWSESMYHGVGAAVVVGVCCIAMLVLALLIAQLGDNAVAVRTPLTTVLAGIAAIALIGALAVFCRPAVEMTAAAILWPIYRIHALGPGVAHLPVRGPALVIGNHAAWFDPLFVAKVLSVPVTPMMTSKFYDLPVLSWLMRHVIGTIRVPDVPFRHEAPELTEAVARLDRGECIVLFPEGYLRRKEEQPLRRFGRGVWKILADRPATPVFACWIEGNWESFLSFRGGPPMRGKRVDFWKKIRIGVVGPITLDAGTLADHMATRTYLMQQVLAARIPLGLEPIDLPGIPADGENE